MSFLKAAESGVVNLPERVIFVLSRNVLATKAAL